MKKKVLAMTITIALMFCLMLIASIWGQDVGEEPRVVMEDLDGPDSIPPPKYYRTLDMILAEAALAREAGLVVSSPGPPPVTVTGTREILVLLAEFSDVAHDPAHTVAYFDDRFFDTTPPSVRDYYDEVSYGSFTYVPGAVRGWYPSTYTQAHYYNPGPPVTRHHYDVFVEAIGDADPFFNFGPYDTDNNGLVENEELTLFMIVSGDQGGAFHTWNRPNVATADTNALGNPVSIEGEYSVTHEDRHIGSYCHELGHDLGLPDLYDTDPQSDGTSTTGLSEGIGEYGLMGGGSWTFSHPTAWSKIQLGWITPTVVTANGYYAVHDAETNAEAYILADPARPNEYFLIENRHPTNSYYETVGVPIAPGGTYPDEGIVIYHIDETQVQDWINFGSNTVNVDETHKGVDVECADSPTSHVINADDLDAEVNRGDASDLWDNTEYDFHDGSAPCSAVWYDGTPSGMDVRDLPAPGSIMTVFLSIAPVTHDVEAVSQSHPHAQVVQGFVEPVDVAVRNNGEMIETFDVVLYADLYTAVIGDEIMIGTIPVVDLAPGASQTITFNWDTTGVISGTYTITAFADSTLAIPETDEDNNWCTDPSTLKVMWEPVADINGPYTDDECTTITFDASGSYDPDGTLVLYEWDWNGDGFYDESSTVPTITHHWGDDYFGVVGLRVTDNDGLRDTDTTTVTVLNVPPTVDAGPDQTVNEGDAVIFSGSFTDPGSLDTHTIEWDFGDGTPGVTGTLNPTHAYGDNGIYVVTLTVTDDDDGVGTDDLIVTVNNVAPTATIDSMTQPNPQFILPMVHTLTFSGSFTDPGWLDTHTATWDFGDGTVVPGTLTEENVKPDATGTTTIDHTYSTPGTYTVTLTITDDDGGFGTDTMQVTVVGAEEAKEDINDYIQALSDDAFKGNPDQRKKAFNNMFSAIDDMLDDEEYQGAIQDLRNNIREKTDGFVDGKPKNDWITDPTAQQEICMKIDDLIAYLETLL